MTWREADCARGSATVLSVLVVWLAAMCALGVGMVGRGLAEAARASAAADAAALAGAAHGREEAESIARANGAVLEEFARADLVVEVRVRVGRALATAAAAPASIH